MFLAYSCDENGKSPRKNLSFPEMAQKSESECSFWGTSGHIPHDAKECSSKISSVRKKNENTNNTHEIENLNNDNDLNNSYNYNYNLMNKSKTNTTNTTSHTASFSLFVSASRCVRFVTDFGLFPQLISEMKIRIIVDELIDRRTGTGTGDNHPHSTFPSSSSFPSSFPSTPSCPLYSSSTSSSFWAEPATAG